MTTEKPTTKLDELHEEHLKSPLSPAKARAALRAFGAARAARIEAEQVQKDLHEKMLEAVEERRTAEAKEQEALAAIVRGYGRVPFEVGDITFDIGVNRGRLYAIPRMAPSSRMKKRGKS